MSDLHCPRCGCTWFKRPHLGHDFDWTRRRCRCCGRTYLETEAHITCATKIDKDQENKLADVLLRDYQNALFEVQVFKSGDFEDVASRRDLALGKLICFLHGDRDVVPVSATTPSH